MNALRQNLIAVIKEQQLKLGYREESIRLFYPASSLNALLGRERKDTNTAEFAKKALKDLAADFGDIDISKSGERFCLRIPVKGCRYVHELETDHGFLQELITAVAAHTHSMEEIIQIFYRHGTQLVVEDRNDGEFDKLLYFADGKPDDFYYLLSNEAGHISYHRFSKADFEEIFSS